MRQHRARKRQVLVQVNLKEEAQYQPHEHSLNGLPQCKHCNLKLSSADALKQHVLTYACRPRKAVDQGARGDAEPAARNNAERRTAEGTVTPPLSTGSPPHRPQHDAAPEETAPGPDLPLLRSREASAYLRQEQIPLQVLTDWAPKLLQHCGFCNHWVAQGGSVKEHIKRMHQCIWDAALERFDDCCLAYEGLILRDHPCELCHQCIRRPGISEIAWSWPKFPLPRRGSRPEPRKPMKFAVSRHRISMRPQRSAYYEDQKNAPRVMRPC